MKTHVLFYLDLTMYLQQDKQLASFSGPAQLFIATSMEKCGEPGIFSHVGMA